MYISKLFIEKKYFLSSLMALTSMVKPIFIMNIQSSRVKKTTYMPILILLTFLSGCQSNYVHSKLEQQLAQKIMLDLRYYCPEMEPKDRKNEQFPCKTPMTKLPLELASLIEESSLGAVILFSENLVDSEQIIQLTSDLRNAALRSNFAQPLFISVDQEGGRVARLPKPMATTFTGNMSVGATHKVYGNYFASSVGEVLGSELNALGINVNHSPTVDVNINPNNPVINVRSFGDDPALVGELGIAMLKGIQSQGVIGTLKHFPGHGDTNVDSHTGLPLVNHDLAMVENVDLLPFQLAIDQGVVDMIMTAHIQYPALDDTVLVNKFGESMIKPATLSYAILTDLLRENMNYQGVIVTDALDMAGISHFFTPLEATLETFNAGADIAMMPMKIRMPDDIKQFKRFLKALASRVSEGTEAYKQLNDSLQRIAKLKMQLPRQLLSRKDILNKTNAAKSILANEKSRALESELAKKAVVEIKKEMSNFSLEQNLSKVHIVFPKLTQSEAMALSLEKQLLKAVGRKFQLSISSLESFSEKGFHKKIQESDVVIVASESQKTAVESGGVEDLSTNQNTKLNVANFALSTLTYAKEFNKKTVFVTLKVPYQLEKFHPVSDWILASFNGNTYVDSATGLVKSPAFDALAAIISGEEEASGSLPILL